MITMETVLKRGRTVWDRAVLPEDEYGERVRLVRRLMQADGVEVLVVIGHSADCGNVTYLSGHAPQAGWMGIVLGREAGPFLLGRGGGRGLPFLRTQTWIEDIRMTGTLSTGPAEVVAAAIAEMAGSGARVAVAGARDHLAPEDYRELRAALAAYQVSDADDLLARARARKRPRELVALRQSLSIALACVEVAVEAWQAGASNREALLAAERTARVQGSHDVRVMGNLFDHVLAPVEGQAEDRRDHLVVYCAVERLGYWGQASATSSRVAAPGPADRIVEAMVACAGPGVPASELAAAAARELPSGERDIALAYGLGGAIGLALTEPPRIALDSPDLLEPEEVLALQVFTIDDGVLGGASRTIRIDEAGVTSL